MEKSLKTELLNKLNLGSSVAEQDKYLSNYFIDTNYVSDFVNDRYDIIQGVKGSGKTAMFLSIYKNKNKYHSLNEVQLIKAMDLKGDPHFREAFNKLENCIDENKLIDAWKIYFINLLWNEIIDLGLNNKQLEKYLIKYNLISDEPGFLGKFIHSLKKAKLKFSNTVENDGSLTQSIELFGANAANNTKKIVSIIDFNYIFSTIDELLEESDKKIWIMLDRLDDAFPKNNANNGNDILALKCLLMAYKDLSTYDNFKIKIFIRNDIFNDITKDGFTSLTHVSAKTMPPISWDKDKMELLLYQRILFNAPLKDFLIDEKNFNIDDYTSSKKIMFDTLFKAQVDIGANNPDTIGWILNHISDGLNNATPRDFIALIETARTKELEQLAIPSYNDPNNYFLINAPSIRKAFDYISRQKLTTQLYAEYPRYESWIKQFQGKKAEHNEDTLRKILGKQWRHRIDILTEIGFIEKKSNSWKIPFLYRVELGIKAGSEF